MRDLSFPAGGGVFVGGCSWIDDGSLGLAVGVTRLEVRDEFRDDVRDSILWLSFLLILGLSFLGALILVFVLRDFLPRILLKLATSIRELQITDLSDR